MSDSNNEEFQIDETKKYKYISNRDMSDVPYQWNTYVTSPCENCSNCCLGCTCICLSIYDITRFSFTMGHIGSCCCTLLFPCWPCIIFAARRKVRVNHKLEGNIISDLLCSFFVCCFPCLTCQLRDEILFLKRSELWELGSGNDFIFSEKCKILKRIPYGVQGKDELIEYGMKNNMFNELNPEEAMINIGKIQRHYDYHLIAMNSDKSSNISKPKEDSNSNLYHLQYLFQENMIRR